MRTLLSVVALLVLLTPAPVRGQQIWLGPRTPDPRGPGVTDWNLLFRPNPEWDQLAGQIQVFLGAGLFVVASDARLKAMASDLAQHHIALAMELGPITTRPGEPCDKHEGYVDPPVIPRILSNLTRAGIRLQILRLDGPLWFGHYQRCKLPLAELVPRVAATLRPLLQAFPDVVVGDVLPPQGLRQFPDWQTTYLTFKRELEAAIGRKLAFLHMDVNWRQPDWPVAIAAVEHLAHGAGMKFGVIYNSDDAASSDEVWVAEAKQHFDELETLYGLIPDQAVFHTWNKYPTHVFPETSDTSQSYLVAQYLLPRTHLTVQRGAAGVQGRLTRVSGQPVPGARIAVDVLGDDPSKPPPMRSISGTVPPQARFAMLGLRVNTECWCSGANDLTLGTLFYRETAGGSMQYDYRYATPPRPEAGLVVTPALVANRTLMHLEVAPNRTVGFNSPAFPVTPGAQFQFQVPLGSLSSGGLFGTATVIWMDAQQNGFKRDNITVGNDATPIAAAITDASGSFAVALPGNTRWRQRPLLLHYAGSPALRAAYAAPP